MKSYTRPLVNLTALYFICMIHYTIALAGTYTVSYSGGSIVTTENGHAITTPYALSNPNTGPEWGSAGNVNCINLNKSGSITCSGQIAATFTFVPNSKIPDDQPPPAVVITETCQAQSVEYGYFNELTLQKVNDGLGFPEIGQGSGNISSGSMSSGIGSYYSIKKNPGYSFSVTCSPSVKAAVSQDLLTRNSGSHIEGGVSFSAAAKPLMIDLGGGIGTQFAHSYLIGQLCTGTLETGGLAASSNSAYSWSPPGGGQPFEQWKLSNTINAQHNGYTPQNAQFITLQSSDLNKASFQCYFQTIGYNVSLNCICNLAVPAGALPAAGLHATLIQSFPYTIQAPSFQSLSATFISDNGKDITLNPKSGQIQLSPITFSATVNTPNQFVINGDEGVWAMVQLITPHRTQSVNGQIVGIVNNGKQELDHALTYRNEFFTASGFEMTLTYFDSITPLPTATSENYSDCYHDWLIYKPPPGQSGISSSYVPLSDMTWKWQSSANFKKNSGWNFRSNNDCKVTIRTGTKPFPTFPEWTFIWHSHGMELK